MPDPGLPRGQTSRHTLLAAAVIVLAFLIGALPLILSGANDGRAARDQNDYHLPTIRQFIRDWPHVDLRNYASATTPGFHIAVAGAGKALESTGIGPPPALNPLDLRLVGMFFTVAFLATVGVAVGRRVIERDAIALTFPLVCSPYIFVSGAWLLPDNAAWWMLALILIVALRPRVDGVTYLFGGLASLGLVASRQSHVWGIGLVWCAALLGSHLGRLGDLRAEPLRRVGRLTLALLATVPAVALLVIFVNMWGGLTPPMFQQGAPAALMQPNTPPVTGGNPVVPGLILTLLGLFSLFYLPYLWPTIREIARRPRWLTASAAAALAGWVIAAIPVSTYDDSLAGRYSGYWNLVKRLPVWHDRSPAVILPAGLGAVMLLVWAAALDLRSRLVFLAAWAGFIAAQTMNSQAWQRYYEPFILTIFALSAARLTHPICLFEGGGEKAARWAWLGPVLLGALLSVVTLGAIRG